MCGGEGMSHTFSNLSLLVATTIVHGSELSVISYDKQSHKMEWHFRTEY